MCIIRSPRAPRSKLSAIRQPSSLHSSSAATRPAAAGRSQPPADRTDRGPGTPMTTRSHTVQPEIHRCCGGCEWSNGVRHNAWPPTPTRCVRPSVPSCTSGTPTTVRTPVRLWCLPRPPALIEIPTVRDRRGFADGGQFSDGIDPVASTCSVQTRRVTVAGLRARCDLHRTATLPHDAEPRPWRPGWSPFLDVDQTLDDASASYEHRRVRHR